MVATSNSRHLYNTISKHDLLERWRIVDAVNLPVSNAEDRDILDDPCAHPSHSSLDDEVQAIVSVHGKIDRILSQHVSDVGKVTFKIRWLDGIITEIGLRMLRQIDYDALEAFQHGLLEEQENNKRSESPFLLRTARRARKSAPRDDTMSDILVTPSSSGDESYIGSNSEPELSLSASDRRSNVPTKDIVPKRRGRGGPRHQQHPQADSTLLPQPRSHVFDVSETELHQENIDPMTGIPYYVDPDVIARHWSVCSRCKRKGKPNGDQRKKRKREGSPKRSKDSLIMSSEEEGRLLLCVTCSAATHEGCLPKLSKKHMRDCLRDGKLGKAFQCSSCLSAKSSSAEGIPACDGCHQVHSIKNVKLLSNVLAQSSGSENSEAAAQSNGVVDQAMPLDLSTAATTPMSQAPKIEDGTGLFRCLRCTRSYHYKCLPPFPDESTRFEDLMFTLPIHDKTIKICNEKNTCPECIVYDKKIDRIITWRISGEPAEKKLHITLSQALDKSKEFLVKWSDTSYRHLTWVSEGWLKCVAKATYKTYTDLHKNRMHATEKELVPLAWKKIDRIMDVQDKDGNRVESSDRFLHKVFAKFQELDNDQACWDSPPSPEDVELYADYQNALNRYTQACKVIPPENMKELVMDVRKASRAEDYSKREMKKQPSFITGGTLMPHQMDGLNWLTYQWERKTSCVLADDMGLGKTIQIVSFLNLLVTRFRIYPFLIVVPNSTASNWLREFEKWAPEMTVVPFYGSNRSRLYTRDKELFRDGQHKLRCHAVILTYQSALAETTLFNKVDFWPVLVIDEAQRMKNNDTLLFKKLMTLNTDHRILMTGTPLQNNIRELINIMHFVDPDKFGDIETLEERYSGLTRDNVQGLHDLLRPYFLRRTKEVVLKNLPPKNEIIVPVSMTSLQKEVCKNLMEKNLISYAALHSGNKKSAQSRRSLSNILMQLRKALNHPYLIPEIEVQQATPELTHQVLIDACAKLKVLHQMLPKLFQNGHRVLIFSTLRIMLDILEDYLTGERIKYARLDGLTPSVDRTRSIDAFNAKDSDIKVFLLTSRAGGVGINLATADTVIIWDFDCNPHVDMQAVGRAYRIGQTKPVLVLRFMTRYSVEEKIAQVAKAKLVMDHLVVEKMDQADFEDQDIESILKFGAQALFDDNSCKDISYDSNAIDRLLDRSALQVLGNRPAGQANENEDDADPESNPKPMSFSFAKVWRADKKDGTLEELVQEDEAQEKENEDFWNRFLREKREKIAAEKANVEHLGRGARRRVHVEYADDIMPVSKKMKRTKKEDERKTSSKSSDREFQMQSDGSREDEGQQPIPPSSRAPNTQATSHVPITNTDTEKLLRDRIRTLLNTNQPCGLNDSQPGLSEYNAQQLLQFYLQLLQQIISRIPTTPSQTRPPPPSQLHQSPLPALTEDNSNSPQHLPTASFGAEHQLRHHISPKNDMLQSGNSSRHNQPQETVHTHTHPPQGQQILPTATATNPAHPSRTAYQPTQVVSSSSKPLPEGQQPALNSETLLMMMRRVLTSSGRTGLPSERSEPRTVQLQQSRGRERGIGKKPRVTVSNSGEGPVPTLRDAEQTASEIGTTRTQQAASKSPTNALPQ